MGNSEVGHMNLGAGRVVLQDDVRLVRSPYADHGELVMLTTWLHVIPDDGIAKTDCVMRYYSNTLAG